MKKIVPVAITVALLMSGCFEKESHQTNLDGKKLLEQKCASCHNLEMPPFTSEDEKAPPIMAVAFHIRSFVKPLDESQRVPDAIKFVKDYVLNPSAEKSFCDKESLKRYGVMPSQKGKVTPEEVSAIATYVFNTYTPENLMAAQKLQREYDSKSAGEKIALKYKCMGCHRVQKKLVGPSFAQIANKYKNTPQNIQNSILHGSQKKWGSRAYMPAFTKINDNDLQTLTEWILKQ